MRQDLVDNDLKEKRCHEREDLNEQRRQQHMPDRAPVAPDRGQNQRKPNVSRINAAAGEPACNENRARQDLRRENRGIKLTQNLRDRIDHTIESCGIASDHHSELPIAHLHDCRQRSAFQALGRNHVDDARLQADELCRTDQIVRSGITIE